MISIKDIVLELVQEAGLVVFADIRSVNPADPDFFLQIDYYAKAAPRRRNPHRPSNVLGVLSLDSEAREVRVLGPKERVTVDVGDPDFIDVIRAALKESIEEDIKLLDERLEETPDVDVMRELREHQKGLLGHGKEEKTAHKTKEKAG